VLKNLPEGHGQVTVASKIGKSLKEHKEKTGTMGLLKKSLFCDMILYVELRRNSRTTL